MKKKDVLLSVLELDVGELNLDVLNAELNIHLTVEAPLFVSCTATVHPEWEGNQIQVDFYMNEKRLAPVSLYGVTSDIEFTQGALDSFLADWVEEALPCMLEDYYYEKIS